MSSLSRLARVASAVFENRVRLICCGADIADIVFLAPVHFYVSIQRGADTTEKQAAHVARVHPT